MQKKEEEEGGGSDSLLPFFSPIQRYLILKLLFSWKFYCIKNWLGWGSILSEQNSHDMKEIYLSYIHFK